MATGQEGTTSARGRVHAHSHICVYTRARVTGDCESQFATTGIRKAGSWIQPRGCVELIGCGGELGHRRFTTTILPPAAWHFVSRVVRAKFLTSVILIALGKSVCGMFERRVKLISIWVKNDKNETRARKQTEYTTETKVGILV